MTINGVFGIDYTNNNDIEKAIGILERTKIHVTEESDTLWTCYENGREFRADIDDWIERLKSKDATVVEKISLAFVPTGKFQEHSLSNGWADEYLGLANQMDQCLVKLKQRLK